MGRPSSFNRQQVLSDALDLFWSRGFHACSLKQLEDVTQMHPGSLYYHFQNKEQLYLMVLEHYLQWQLQPRIDKYLTYSPNQPGLRRFFTSGYRHRAENSYRNCCFLVSASNELHMLPAAAKLAQRGMAMLQGGFLSAVNKLDATQDADQTVIAGELLNLYLSLQLMARVHPNQHTLDSQVRRSLDNLLAKRSKTYVIPVP